MFGEDNELSNLRRVEFGDPHQIDIVISEIRETDYYTTTGFLAKYCKITLLPFYLNFDFETASEYGLKSTLGKKICMAHVLDNNFLMAQTQRRNLEYRPTISSMQKPPKKPYLCLMAGRQCLNKPSRRFSERVYRFKALFRGDGSTISIMEVLSNTRCVFDPDVLTWSICGKIS